MVSSGADVLMKLGAEEKKVIESVEVLANSNKAISEPITQYGKYWDDLLQAAPDGLKGQDITRLAYGGASSVGDGSVAARMYGGVDDAADSARRVSGMADTGIKMTDDVAVGAGSVGTGMKTGGAASDVVEGGTDASGTYSKTYYEGTTKVGGQERDISRTVYQRNDIDWNRIDPETGLTNKELAQAGLAPYANDGTKIELHHILQQEPGPEVEIPASLHDKYYKTLHGLVGDGESFRNNPDLEKQYNNFRSKYWRWRAKNL